MDKVAAACRSDALARPAEAAQARHSGKLSSLCLSIRTALLILCLFPAPVNAAPSIAWIFPPGGQRGTTLTLTVSGDDLTDVSGLFATGTGLKAEPLPASEPLRPPLVTLKPGEKPKAPDAKNFRQFRVHIAPDAPLGRQEVRVFGPSGISNARYFH